VKEENRMARLAGKVAMVTGAGTGIGLATAKLFAEEGAKVVVAELDEASGRAAAGAVKGLFVKLDAREEADWARALAEVKAKHGALHVLVNNAGVLCRSERPDVENTSLDEWRWLQRVNVEGVFLGCKLAIPLMRDSGGGSIVNLSSIAGLMATPHLAAYGASKGAVRQLTKSVAVHCGRRGDGIRCNSVHPGLIETQMGEKVSGLGGADPAQTKETRRKMVPLGRLGRPEDVASCILFLASDDSRYMTGAELVVDGGFTVV
jgi:NAD(P)-dependent dehydrogenase (short-subunit alcohol dehydrogenase family)